MDKLEDTLNNMSITELTERFNKLQRKETHYKKLKIQTREILIKKQWKELNENIARL